MNTSWSVTDTVLQLGSHDSAIYLFGSHIYLGGMARDCELNHSARGCQCTGRSPWITHWKAITQTSKVHCHLISHCGPGQATDWSALHTLCSLGTLTNSAPPSISPISIPISILYCWNHSITYSKVWVWLCLSKFCHPASIVCETEGRGPLFCHTVCSRDGFSYFYL